MGKVQIDGKTIKLFDQASTPFRRVLVTDQVSFAVKVILIHQFILPGPVQLRMQIN